jgi:hypothetical protein
MVTVHVEEPLTEPFVDLVAGREVELVLVRLGNSRAAIVV